MTSLSNSCSSPPFTRTYTWSFVRRTAVTSLLRFAGWRSALLTPVQMELVPFFHVQSLPVERNCLTVNASRYFRTYAAGISSK